MMKDILFYGDWTREFQKAPQRIPKGKALPLQCNLAGLNAISFDKGCYVGREMVDTRDVGVVPKRMLPLKFLNANGNEVEDKVAPKTDVIDETSGKKVGTITAELACRGLGLLRLEAAFRKPSSSAIQGQENVKVKVQRPDWWSAEWLADD